MTFEQLIQHVTKALPGRKVTLRYDSEFAAYRYKFSLWNDNSRIIGGAYGASIDDLRDAFDAWLAEQNFTSPYDGVHLELQESRP